MTREEIITGLQERGYNAEAQDVVKNGVVFKGIMFKSETEESDTKVAPIIYTSDIIKEAEVLGIGLGAVISKIENEYKNNKDLNINFNNLHDRSYILNNIYIKLQRESDENLTKRKCIFDGIESCMYVRVEECKNGCGYIKVYDAFLESIGIEVNEAWECAKRNTNNASVLIPMHEVIENVIKENLGEDAVSENDYADVDVFPLYVLSNQYNIYGASSILNRHLLMEFATKFHTDKIVVLPSSIHEVLIMPYEIGLNVKDFTPMVREINNTEVKPEERLGNNAYLVNPFKNWAYAVES